MREICTSGSVRGEGGNTLTYSASSLHQGGYTRLRGLWRDPTLCRRDSTLGLVKNSTQPTPRGARLAHENQGRGP
jgi:hypothetical protein